MDRVWLPVLLQRHGLCVDEKSLLLPLGSVTHELLVRNTVSLRQRWNNLFEADTSLHSR